MGISVIRSAFPQRSPRPLIVPCICLAPALIAAKLFATARPISLWQCIPIFASGIYSFVLLTISKISSVNVPPFVSHKIIHLAPPSKAALTQAKAKSGFAL